MWRPNFLRRERTVVDPATGRSYVAREASEASAAERAAYRDGRVDQHRIDEQRLEERRLEARRRRRPMGGGFGMLAALVLMLAIAGGAFLALSVREGSFSGAGGVVDRRVAEATEPARQSALAAVDRSGAAIEDAGQSIEQQGAKLRRKAGTPAS